MLATEELFVGPPPLPRFTSLIDRMTVIFADVKPYNQSVNQQWQPDNFSELVFPSGKALGW